DRDAGPGRMRDQQIVEDLAEHGRHSSTLARARSHSGDRYHRAMRPGSWVPPLVWMAVIAALSTSPFGAGTTVRIIPPIVGWLLPWLSPAPLDLVHIGIRKAAHLTEYAILAGLWWRGFTRDGVLRARAAGAVALAVSVGWACVDEALQSLAPGRGS